VTGLGEILGDRCRIGQRPHGGGPVRCGDAGADALFGVDGDRVRGAVLVLVDRVHGQQTQAVADGAVQRHTEITRGVTHHERHQFGGGLLGGENQIALVFAVFVVDDHDGLARRDVGHGPLDGIEPRHLVPPFSVRISTSV
jgi:hypothetical protein